MCQLQRLSLQQALIDDPMAPAAPVPLWSTPWHHPQWRERLPRAAYDVLRETATVLKLDLGRMQ